MIFCKNWQFEFEQKTPIFDNFLGENILQIITLGPGINVMITIFCDYRHFSQKPIEILHILALF
jgi:hypothetical protein